MDAIQLLGYNFYAILIATVFSYMIWGNHWIFRIFQNCVLGISAANVFVVGIGGIQSTIISPIQKGTYDALGILGVIIAVVIGLLNYSILIPKYSWLSRITIAFSLGIGMGMGFGRGLAQQLTNLMQLFKLNTIDAVLILIITIIAVTYWIFRPEPKNPTIGQGFRWIRRLGIYVILMYYTFVFAGLVVTESSGSTAWVTFYINWLKTGFGFLQ